MNQALPNAPHTVLSRIRRRVVSPLSEPLGELPEILRRVYAARGIRGPRELARGLSELIPPRQMKDADRAARLIADVMANGGQILIVGDFDADGATATALGVLALRAMGHARVDFLVPNRFEFGYGLTPEIVALARARRPDLIITVDNGIASLEGVAAAHAAGIPVLVTDHHLPGERLPEAEVIVNPNLPDNEFASKATAGVGVIFYVLLALRALLIERHWFADHDMKPPNMAQFLDLVALGTVADVVPLDRNNRILVHQGLLRIRARQCRPGILALLALANRDPVRTGTAELGFVVGPRLNAAGRLDDMSRGIACLLSDDPAEARELASTLDALNRERRRIEQDMREQAEGFLAAWDTQADTLPWGLCLFHEDWHQGVIGILASRIKERHHRPVIAFARAEPGMLKGSARSIPGLHVRDALDHIATREAGLLQKFGGHAMAAGLSLREADFPRFAAAFDRLVRERLDAAELHQQLLSDGGIPPENLTLETAQILFDGGPWGQGFSEPLFDDLFEVRGQRVVGERHWKLLLTPEGGGEPVDAIAFNAVALHPRLPRRIHAAYRMDINEWRGRRSLQLRIEYLEPA